MQLVLLLPSALVFLYSLYKLVKDDYVFIRKGISLEQSFDIAFASLWVSLIFSRVTYLLFNFDKNQNIFLEFFRFRHGSLSLTGFVLGGIIALYFISKYKRLPLGRLSDFLSLSFLFALPVGFIVSSILYRKAALLNMLLSSVLYFMLIIFFIQFLYPKLMSRTLREGTLGILFLGFFSIFSLLTTFIATVRNIPAYLNFQTAILVLLVLVSIILFLKVEKPFTRTRRTLHR